MKLVYLNDTHLRVQRPSCRRDENFYRQQLVKLREALSIASFDNPIRLHGGDLFHVFNSPLSLLHDVLPIIKDCGRLRVNAGNHDFPYGNAETLRRSGLGLLSAANAIDLLTAGDYRVMDNGDLVPLDEADPMAPGVKLRSAPYMLSYPEEFYQVKDKRPGDTWIIMSHDMLSTRSCPFPHREIKNLKTNADLILCSHLHAQFAEKIGATWFVNSGPLDCQTTTERKVRPAVAVIDIDGGEIKPRLEFLKTTGYEEVEVAEEEQRDLGLADDFVAMVKSSGLAEGADFQQAVLHVAKESGYSGECVDRVLSRIKQAQTCGES